MMGLIIEKEPLFTCADCGGEYFKLAKDAVVTPEDAYLIATCQSCQARHMVRMPPRPAKHLE